MVKFKITYVRDGRTKIHTISARSPGECRKKVWVFLKDNKLDQIKNKVSSKLI
jgi:hypothetical protein